MSVSSFFNGFMNGLGGFFSSSVVQVILWILIGGTVVFFAWRRWVKHKSFTYNVLLVGGNNQLATKKAKIINSNKGVAKLVVEGYEDPKFYLTLKETNGIFNGKPIRILAFDGFGYLTYADAFKIKEIGLSSEEVESRRDKLLAFADSLGFELNHKYFDKIKVDKKAYLETCLTPIDRLETHDSVVESLEKGNIMNQVQKWVFTLSMILIVMSVIGNIMVAKYNVQAIEVGNDGATYLKEASQILNNNTVESIKSIDRNTVMLIRFAEAMGQNITLEIGTK